MTRGVDHPEAELADDQELPVVDPQVGEGRRGAPVHDDAGPELTGELAGGGEVVGMGMAVDHVADAEPLLHGERDVAVDQIERRIDDHPGARLLAAGDVGEAAPGTKLLEEHRRWWSRRASRVKPGWWVYGLVAGGVCDPTRGGAP